MRLCGIDKILKEIDRVNKEIQRKDIILSRSVSLLKGLITTMRNFRESTGSWIEAAEKLADELIEPTPDKRVPKKKKMPGETAEDESRNFSPNLKFRQSINEILDTISSDLERRLQTVEEVHDLFSFLNGEEMKELNDDDLKKHAKDFAMKYAMDVDPYEFVEEIEVFRIQARELSGNLLKLSPFNLLNLIAKNDLKDAFPNFAIALRLHFADNLR